MKKLSKINIQKFVYIFQMLIIVVLLVSLFSPVLFEPIVFAVDSNDIATSSNLSKRINPATGQPYGDLRQYEWDYSALTWSRGNDPSMTKYSAGPAPNTPNVLWSLNKRDDIGELIYTTGMFGTGPFPEGFWKGLVIIRSRKAGVQYINALDPFTGELKWQIPHPGSGAIARLDDNHFRVIVGTITGYDFFGNPIYDPASIKWVVFNIADGSFAFNTTTGVPSTGNIIRDAKVLVTTETGVNSSTRWLVGYDLSNLQQGANIPVLWKHLVQGSPSIIAYGDGKLFYGSWGDYYVRALDVRTGNLVWAKYGPTNLRDGIYYNGKLYTAGVGQFLITYNGTTGEPIWNWTGGPRYYFANAGCAAYGRFYSSVVAVDSLFACWDDESGEILWQLPACYFIGYFSPVIADGKVYAILSDGRGVSESTYKPPAFTACIDAFTGQILWTLPFTMGHGTRNGGGGFRSDVAIAYGILWFSYQGTLYAISDLNPKPWSMWRGNSEQPGVAIGQSGPSQLNIRWKFQTGGPVTSSPAVVDGKVYIGSYDKNIYCLDAYTGSLIWSFPTNYRVLSSVAVVGGKVFTGADDGNIYCINATTGQQLWKKYVNGTWEGSLDFEPSAEWPHRSSPIVIGARLYVGALDGKVYCLDTVSGNILWTYPTYGPILGSPTYSNGVVYIASTDLNYGNGGLYALNATNGQLIWRTTVAGSGRTSLTGTPIVAEGKVFIGGGTASPYGIRAYYVTNGSIAKLPDGSNYILSVGGTTPKVATPVYYMGVLYYSGMWSVQAWNASTGVKLWEQWHSHQIYSSSAVAAGIDGVKIYTGTNAGSLTCLNSTGGILGVFETTGLIESSPAVWNRKVYVGHSDGNIYCLEDTPTVCTEIIAWCDWKEATVGENIIVHSRLLPGGVPNEQLILTLIKPDGTSVNVTATTDLKGWVHFSFTPDTAGNWTWIVWYQGKDKEYVKYSYDHTDACLLTVKSTTLPSTEQGALTIPIEVIYAAIIIVVILIVAVAAYFLKKGKK